MLKDLKKSSCFELELRYAVFLTGIWIVFQFKLHIIFANASQCIVHVNDTSCMRRVTALRQHVQARLLHCCKHIK